MTDRVLGSPWITRPWRRLTGGRLRVLAYHGVPNPLRFADQMEWLAERFRFVSGAEVGHAIRSGGRLPDSVWLTFDDGFASTVQFAMPILKPFDAPATMFICPAFIEGQLPWWLVCEALGVPREEIAALKSVPNTERQARVQLLQGELDQEKVMRIRSAMAGVEAVRQWAGAGLELGNHTWDHPCLDTCPPGLQRWQIDQAEAWMTDNGFDRPSHFAFPNGNPSPSAAVHLRKQGYSPGLLFDHATAAVADAPGMSRLRIDADAPLPRTAAIAAGPHALLMHARDRLMPTA